MFDDLQVHPSGDGGAAPSVRQAFIDESWMTDAETAMKATLDGEVLGAIIARPEFRDLLRPWIEAWRVGEHDSAILATTMRDLGRFVVGVWALYLEATPGGLSRGRLGELLTESGFSGAGRAASVLLFLRFLGFIETAPDLSDGRTTRYRATERMRKAFRARFQRDLASLAAADPVVARMSQALEDPAAFGAYAAAMGGHLRLALKQLGPNEDALDVFSQRYGGMALLAELMLSAPDEAAFPPRGPLQAKVADLARRAMISRSQVRGILKAGEDAGFLDLAADNSYRLTARLVEHVDLLTAGCLVISAYASRQAAMALDARSAKAG